MGSCTSPIAKACQYPLLHTHISGSIIALYTMYAADLLQLLCSSTKLLAKSYL